MRISKSSALGSILLCLFCLLWPACFNDPVQAALGVNWGDQASHPLPPNKMVEMLQANNIKKVKLFDSNNSVLRALAGTDIEVMVAIPNNLLLSLNDQAQANTWVQNNVVRYMFSGGTNIRYVAVGNEPFLEAYNGTFVAATYPALVNVQEAIINANLGGQVKVTVPLNADVIAASKLPSRSTFRDDILDYMMKIVAYLAKNNAPFMINIYPFLSLYGDKNFPVAFAFFDGTSSPIIDNQNKYYNVFDASYDSLVAALSNAGYGNMSIIVGEIGWPTDGDVNANIDYARRFNQGFLDHVSTNMGTPLRPGTEIDFYLFSLIDEDRKSIAPGNFERHWGIFRYDGKPKYSLSLSGSNGQNLVPVSGVHYLTQQWCVLNPNAGDKSSLPESFAYACTYSDCTSLGYGCSCHPYLTDANGNASYAFNQYFQMNNQQLGACSFNGLAQVVTQNPSIDKCEFIVQIAYTTSAAPLNIWKRTGAILWAITPLIYFSL